jgi:hypothetical protein
MIFVSEIRPFLRTSHRLPHCDFVLHPKHSKYFWPWTSTILFLLVSYFPSDFPFLTFPFRLPIPSPLIISSVYSLHCYSPPSIHSTSCLCTHRHIDVPCRGWGPETSAARGGAPSIPRWGGFGRAGGLWALEASSTNIIWHFHTVWPHIGQVDRRRGLNMGCLWRRRPALVLEVFLDGDMVSSIVWNLLDGFCCG